MILTLCCFALLCACSNSKNLVDEFSSAPSIPAIKKLLGENYKDGQPDDPYYAPYSDLFQLRYDDVDFLGYKGTLFLKYAKDDNDYSDREKASFNEFYWYYEKGDLNEEQFGAVYTALKEYFTKKFGESTSSWPDTWIAQPEGTNSVPVKVELSR